jgi:Zn-dependent peptidase ImmA (M78 family)
MGLPRGFKSRAEETAEEIRNELGIGLFAKIDPLALAESLAIPVLSLSELRRFGSQNAKLGSSIDLLLGSEGSAFSAATVFMGGRRVILHNDSHAPGRQAANLCHEISHGLLLHKPRPALDGLGCRDWDDQIEDEATYLASTILIPGKAARGAVTRGLSLQQVAAYYGTSVQMAQWRHSTSGAFRLSKR